MPNTPITPGTPTQVAHPWKATVRTFVAYLTGALLAWPALVAIITDTLGPHLPESWVTWLGGTLGGVAAVAAFITRLMAATWMQPILAKIGLGTGVEKEETPTPPAPTPVADEDGLHRGEYLGG